MKLVPGWFGNLMASSEDGAGSSSRGFPRPEGRRPAPSGLVEKARLIRVLIIDDEPQVAAALRRLLHRHDVQVAHSGLEARRLIAQSSFDVVISDVMMPEPSGLDVYAELASKGASLVERFIFVTGGVHGQKAQKFLASVPNPQLDKPVDVAELEQAIRGVLLAQRETAGAG